MTSVSPLSPSSLLPLSISHLNECDAGPQGGVDVGELQADVARPDDRDPLREPLKLEGMVTGEHSLAIDGDA